MHGTTDHGWIVDHGRVVAVYDDKDFAEKEAKWLNDFKKRCGAKGICEVKKWIPEDGVETALQVPEKKGQQPSMPKMGERVPKTDAAPMPSIPTNLSDLLVSSPQQDRG